jgi:hypothetical protein
MKEEKKYDSPYKYPVFNNEKFPKTQSSKNPIRITSANPKSNPIRVPSASIRNPIRVPSAGNFFEKNNFEILNEQPKKKGFLIPELRPQTAKAKIGFGAINQNLQELVDCISSSGRGEHESNIEEVESFRDSALIEKYAPTNNFRDERKNIFMDDFDEKDSEDEV